MPLATGARLGPYEILAPLGAGGMGEVYTARDARLGRDVALKVAGEAFTERFSREARAIAALNHTNICHLYDVGPDYLVMELVEGESPRGPMTFGEALPLIRQLIDGIEAAHERLIVHRDLKPANIKVTPDGVLKILDFGLAKTIESDALVGNPTNSPTFIATQQGVIVGTSAYMAPEQARGKAADQRADIWAFGVIVYELLTGTKPFPGETTVEILGAVLNREPDLSAAPAQAQGLLRWCLEKDRKKRLQAIGDARHLLDHAPVAASVSAARPARRWPGFVAAALTLPLVAAAAWTLKPTPPAPPLMSFEITAPEGTSFGPVGNNPSAVISPDGTQVLLVANGSDGNSMLWLRPLASNDARAIPGTEGAARPFWSADGRTIGFLAGGKLKRLVLGSNQPQVLADAEGGSGDFTREGAIVFGSTSRPLRIATIGKADATLFELDRTQGEISQGSPQVLPDGRHLLYQSNAQPETSAVFATLDGSSRRVIIGTESSPASYVGGGPNGTGWLLHSVRNGELSRLVAHAFDPSAGTLTGDPVVIVDPVPLGPSWSASGTGVLMFRQPREPLTQLQWVARDGKPLGDVAGAGNLGEARLSSDGGTIAYRKTVDGDSNIWLMDPAGNAQRRLTFDRGREADPVWSSDGQRLFYTGPGAILERPSSGVGAEREIVKGRPGAVLRTTAVSPDNRWIAARLSGTGQSQVVLVSREDGRTIPVQEPGSTYAARFSPDGRWLVYVTIVAGQSEVFIRTLPKEAGGPADVGKWQLSNDGGNFPVWRGTQIFYVSRSGAMMAATVDVAASGGEVRVVGTPTRLFDAGGGRFDVTADGQRFLVERSASASSDVPATVIVNWTKLLQK